MKNEKRDEWKEGWTDGRTNTDISNKMTEKNEGRKGEAKLRGERWWETERERDGQK